VLPTSTPFVYFDFLTFEQQGSLFNVVAYVVALNGLFISVTSVSSVSCLYGIGGARLPWTSGRLLRPTIAASHIGLSPFSGPRIGKLCIKLCPVSSAAPFSIHLATFSRL
jgi:hypothetical protein